MSPKKDFKMTNPALQFLSNTTEAEELGEAGAKPVRETEKENNELIPSGYQLKPEAKSRRVQALVQPSIYHSLKEIATAKGISVNEALNEAMRLYVTNESK